MKKVPPGEAAHFFSARMTPKSSGQQLENGHAQTKMIDGRSWP
jgi:hypothetical protein